MKSPLMHVIMHCRAVLGPFVIDALGDAFTLLIDSAY
jgi:hypothetical protein